MSGTSTCPVGGCGGHVRDGVCIVCGCTLEDEDEESEE